MSSISRRELLARVGTAATGGVLFTWTAEDAARAAQSAQVASAQARESGSYVPVFFTPREYATIVALSDMIIPGDAQSPGAVLGGAPPFIDYIVSQQPERQTAMRGGLVWLDTECRRRFDKAFLECADAQRRAVLDDIAWPAKARPEFSHGVRFFTTMRDLVATGFFSSRAGVAYLGYLGNRPAVWDGPPPEVLAKLGLQ
jgi:gluconate 2-dehydrogenase gamma chain